MSQFNTVVRAVKSIRTQIGFSMTKRDGSIAIDVTDATRNAHSDLEWHGSDVLVGSHMNDQAVALERMVADATHELAIAKASEEEWEARAEAIQAAVAREVLRTMFDNNPPGDFMRMASWVAKREAMRKIGSAFGILDSYFGLSESDIGAVISHRREQAAEQARKDRETVTSVSLAKVGSKYVLRFHNRHGVELHEAETEQTRFGDAKREARHFATERGLRFDG